MSELLSAAGQWGGWFAALLAALAALYPKMRRADLDENKLAVTTWQEMCARHEAEISTLRSRLQETDDLLDRERRERRQNEDEYHATIRELRDEIAGLKRAIAQNSHSSVAVLEPKHVSN